jgi:hypothetical protein
MTCPRCGAGVAAQTRFCVRCGAQVTATADSPTAAASYPATGPAMGSPLWAPSGPGSDPGWAPSPPTSRHGRAPSPSTADPGWAPSSPAAGPTAQPGWGSPPPAASAPPQSVTGWAPAGTPHGPAAACPGPAARDRGLRVVAGILSIAGALVIVAASLLPYARLPTGSGHYDSLSILRPGTGSTASALWYAVEPVGVALLGIVLGVLLMVIRKGRLPAVVAGMLIAFGIQTVLLFLGYALGFSFATYKPGSAGPVGVLGGLLLACAGVMGAASRGARG